MCRRIWPDCRVGISCEQQESVNFRIRERISATQLLHLTTILKRVTNVVGICLADTNDPDQVFVEMGAQTQECGRVQQSGGNDPCSPFSSKLLTQGQRNVVTLISVCNTAAIQAPMLAILCAKKVCREHTHHTILLCK